MKKEILIYGDSNTWGYIPVPYEPPLAVNRRGEDLRWPCITAKDLGEEYHIIEEGLSGRRSIYGEGEDWPVNGEPYLTPCLLTHSPLDLVVIMLGTNDLRIEYGVTRETLGVGISRLVDIVQSLPDCGHGVKPPKVLIIAPGLIVHPDEFMEHYKNRGYQKGEELSAAFGEAYHAVAEEKGCEFLNAADFVTTSPIDGLHMDDASHIALGHAVAEKIEEIFS